MITALYIKTTNALHDFKNDQRGVTAIEYAIIGVAMSAIVLAVFNGTLQDALAGAMDTITANINSAAGTPPAGG